MKIAIPSNDKVTISSHFGRTKGFMICEIKNGKIIQKEYKENTFTGHAHGSHHDEGHEHGNHSHNGIFDAIGDCTAVIAGGMGQRLYNDFENRNIQIFVTREVNIDKALQLYIDGKLDNNSDKCCTH